MRRIDSTINLPPALIEQVTAHSKPGTGGAKYLLGNQQPMNDIP